jgi:hypothetical protein
VVHRSLAGAVPTAGIIVRRQASPVGVYEWLQKYYVLASSRGAVLIHLTDKASKPRYARLYVEGVVLEMRLVPLSQVLSELDRIRGTLKNYTVDIREQGARTMIGAGNHLRLYSLEC